MPLTPLDNYTFQNLPDPLETVRKNLATVQDQQSSQQKNALFGFQMQQAQIQQAQQQRFQSDLALMSQNPTHETVQAVMARNPQFAESLKPMMESVDATEKKALVSQLGPAYSALAKGKPDIAIDHLNTVATSFDNANKPQEAAAVRQKIALIQKDPGVGMLSIAAPLSLAMGSEFANIGAAAKLPDELRKGTADADTAVVDADVKKKFGMQQGEADLNAKNAATKASLASAANSVSETDVRNKTLQGLLDKNALDLKNVQSEIDARGVTGDLAKKKADIESQQAALVRAKTEAETTEIRARIVDLPADIRKEVNGHVDASEKARTEADVADTIAGKLDKISGLAASGGPAQAAEAAKALFGGQDGITQTRKEAARFVNSQIFDDLHNLGVNRVNPAEIDLLKKAMPDPTIDPSGSAAYMRASANVKRAAADLDSAKAAWKSSNRSDLAAPAKITFSVGSRQVHPGDTFEKFLSRTPAQDARLADLKKKAATP